MATTITPPNNYCTVKKPCVYKITKDTTEVSEVSINGYIKQMRGNAYQINVSDYYKESFNLEPLLEPQQADAYDIRRAVYSDILVDGVNGRSVLLLWATKMPTMPQFLNNIKKQNVLPTDIIEVAAINDAPYSIVLTKDKQGASILKTYSFSQDCGIAVFTPPTTDKFWAHLKVGGKIIDTIEYNVIEHCCGVRLAWVNRFGGIESYRFAYNQERALSAVKNNIYGINGYMVTNVEAEESTTISTKKHATATINALSDIITSDKVFIMYDDNTFDEVLITTNNTKIYNINGVQNIQVTFRPKERKI